MYVSECVHKYVVECDVVDFGKIEEMWNNATQPKREYEKAIR